MQKTWLNAKKYPLQYHITLNITNILAKHRQYPPQYPRKTQASSIIQLLLILSGSVEINPGPRAPKFPCEECHKAVSIGPSIACDNCDQWFHKHEYNYI